MNDDHYIELFKDYLEENFKSVATINSYITDLKQFLAFLKQEKGKTLTQVKSLDLREFKAYLKANTFTSLRHNKKPQRLKLSSINRKLVSINQFLLFLREELHLEINAKVKQEKIQKQYSLKDDQLLSEQEYQRLIDTVQKVGDLRSQAMFEAMYYTGMRVSEMLQLKLSHIGQSIIDDIKGKGGKYRDIYLNNKLQATLKAYVSIRKAPVHAPHCEFLFVGERGRITPQTVHNLLKKYAALAEIPKEKAHTHNLRHLFAIQLSKKGIPLDTIAKFMGHSNINTTKIYTEKAQSHYVDVINQLF